MDIFHFNFSACSNDFYVTFITTPFLNYNSVPYHTSVFYKHSLVWGSL